MSRLVYGVGVNDGKYPTHINKKPLKQYKLWTGLLERCYSWDDKYKSYENCEVSSNFKKYSYFYEWCLKQVGFGFDGFEIDKDILSVDSKIYSEKTCCFIPRSINVLLTNSKATRGDFPIGVSFDKRTFKFYAKIRIDGKQKHIGTFLNKDDAFNAYKFEKINEIKRQALINRGLISNIVFDKLMNYDLNIDS